MLVLGIYEAPNKLDFALKPAPRCVSSVEIDSKPTIPLFLNETMGDQLLRAQLRDSRHVITFGSSGISRPVKSA
jgi:hypothetical protein